MRSLYNYIISTNSRYDNKVSVGSKELILNTEITERDYLFVNRIGTVINAPINIKTPIESGNEVIVHHNVFRRWYDVRGNERNSGNYIKEDTYTVSEEQIFAYKQNGKWHCPIQYCFVEPLENKDVWSTDSEQKLIGKLTYTNDYLSSLGLSCGDVVGFTPNSEYEFNIEDKKLYRILSKDITINYGHKENKTTTT
jgi:hypothetical protein|tara:strand:+ start:1247 stop:1834 length:588 start_codon:yes stop_codon:yes gene_type:complete